MQAYEISKNEGVEPDYARNLAAVRAIIRTIPRPSRDYARIYLVACADEKDARIAVMNCREPSKVERTRLDGWRLSVRGRMIPLANLED